MQCPVLCCTLGLPWVMLTHGLWGPLFLSWEAEWWGFQSPWVALWKIKEFGLSQFFTFSCYQDSNSVLSSFVHCQGNSKVKNCSVSYYMELLHFFQWRASFHRMCAFTSETWWQCGHPKVMPALTDSGFTFMNWTVPFFQDFLQGLCLLKLLCSLVFK